MVEKYFTLHLSDGELNLETLFETNVMGTDCVICWTTDDEIVPKESIFFMKRTEKRGGGYIYDFIEDQDMIQLIKNRYLKDEPADPGAKWDNDPHMVLITTKEGTKYRHHKTFQMDYDLETYCCLKLLHDVVFNNGQKIPEGTIFTYRIDNAYSNNPKYILASEKEIKDLTLFYGGLYEDNNGKVEVCLSSGTILYCDDVYTYASGYRCWKLLVTNRPIIVMNKTLPKGTKFVFEMVIEEDGERFVLCKDEDRKELVLAGYERSKGHIDICLD